jgi:hypothetical protein
MASSLVNQLTPLFIILGLAAVLVFLQVMDGRPRWIYGRPERLKTQATRPPQGDEEQGRINRQRDSWVSLHNLPRYSPSSATTPMLPNAAPPAYLPGRRRAEYPADLPPRPIADLPRLDPGYPPAACPRQQSPPQDLSFVLFNDSTESLKTVLSPWEQFSSQARMPFPSDSTESTETEATDFVNPASTSTSFQASAVNSPGVGHFPFCKPLPFSLQVHTSTGTVQTHMPAVESPISPDAKFATGNFVSEMVKYVETGVSTNLSSRTEPLDQGEPPHSPLLNSVLNRISNAQERWAKIDV